MMTARFFSGASLFVLLIVDICCFPFKGSDPSASYGGSSSNAAPNFGSKQGASSSQFSPPSKGVSTPSYEPVSQLEPRYTQPALQRQPAAPSFSGPVSSGYRGSSVRQNPASSTQPGTAFHQGPKDINWAVAAPSLSSGGRGVGFSRPEYVSPPLPPPGPVYQAGELSHYEESIENGDYKMETEEQGYLPPPPPFPMKGSVEQGFTSQPQPGSSMGRSWGTYPYYDFMFLTGQYPPGTVSHSSSSYEQGSDSWQDSHYIRDYYSNPGPAQEIKTLTGDSAAPQSFEDPRQLVKMAPYGQGGAQAGVPASLGNFMQPGHSQTGGYNTGKAGY